MDTLSVELWQLLLIIGTLLATLIAFIWVAIRLGNTPEPSDSPKDVASASVNQAVNQAFTDEFRDELRVRARQQFEELIHQNAMFLQQDVRVSAAQLDDFMKKEVISTLQQELAKHHESLNQTRQLLSDSITKSQSQIDQAVAEERERRIKVLDEQLNQIVKQYVMAAVGDTIDIDKELALIVDNLQAHKAEIIEDIRRGA